MIDAETQERLRAKYNPDGSDLRRAQLRMLEMLKYIDEICRRENIRYWLDSGTLLGAVRHGGFIPWDDDTDIGMMMEDAQRFMQYVVSHPSDEYALQSYKTDSNHVCDWIKLRDLKSEYIQKNPIHNAQKFKGLQVDIFIFDTNVIGGLQKIMGFLGDIRFRLIDRGCIMLARLLNSVLRCVVSPVCRLFGRMMSDGAKLRHTYGVSFYKARPYSSLFPLKDICFEGCNFLVPNDSDEYLRSVYGSDYGQLPPEEKIETHLNDGYVFRF